MREGLGECEGERRGGRSSRKRGMSIIKGIYAIVS